MNIILKAWKTVSSLTPFISLMVIEAVAIDIANEIIHQRYQPATPSFLNAGRARRGVGILLPDPSN